MGSQPVKLKGSPSSWHSTAKPGRANELQLEQLSIHVSFVFRDVQCTRIHFGYTWSDIWLPQMSSIFSRTSLHAPKRGLLTCSYLGLWMRHPKPCLHPFRSCTGRPRWSSVSRRCGWCNRSHRQHLHLAVHLQGIRLNSAWISWIYSFCLCWDILQSRV